MDKAAKEAVSKIQELNRVIKSLDPSIREQSFEYLRPYFLEVTVERGKPTGTSRQNGDPNKTSNSLTKELFFSSFSHKKPSDNVFFIMAWLYSQHGAITISSEMIDTVAKEIGLTVSKRPDMTLKAAQKNRKRLFLKQSQGYAPTVHGEAFLKDAYKVEKGNLPLQEEPKK